jgi:hypothetical protein
MERRHDMAERSWQETLQVEGKDLVERVNRLIGEGNVRRIILKQDDRVLFEVPMSAGVAVGVAAVAFAPVLAAVAAVAGLVAKVTLEVERTEETPDTAEQPLHAAVNPTQHSTPPDAGAPPGEQYTTHP